MRSTNQKADRYTRLAWWLSGLAVVSGLVYLMATANTGPADPTEQHMIMHSQLETLDGLLLMGADTPEAMEYRPQAGVSVSLSGDDEARLRGYWERLSEGGSVTMPFEKAPWGDTFGMCVDKFGTSWMVNAAGQPT